MRLVLLDLDGTMYDREAPVAGAAEAVEALRAGGFAVRFFTNTDSQSAASMLARARARGVPAAPGDVFTPVTAAQRYLGESARVLLLANAAVRGDLAASCTLTSADVTHVIIGDCHEILTFDLLDAAFRAVRAGAELIALQRGRYTRNADGDHLDTGAVVAAVEYAAEVEARLLGKPSVDFLRLAAGDATDVWVVGDDRSTDIAMANAGGARSVQVRTGKYADQRGRDDLPVPAYVIDSVVDLPALLSC
ncbi:TIGR01458 family HAD-type hydrolase [Winogradskya consettensis]|uniref:Hydrolase n=1 Tax=Winogradskya consettensis TaxID=113560 RepID=A0A919SAZ8_9ACTN|nr:HAD hydrolase-like protein [Actinoplanes consettensis]GIM67109.1 hydrolase [Actinoplanes consettensis]